MLDIELIGRRSIALKADLGLRGTPQTCPIDSTTPCQYGQSSFTTKGCRSAYNTNHFRIILRQGRRSCNDTWIGRTQLILLINHGPTGPDLQTTKLPLEFNECVKAFSGGRQGDLFLLIQGIHDTLAFGFEGKEIAQIPTSWKGIGLQGLMCFQRVSIGRSSKFQPTTIVLSARQKVMQYNRENRACQSEISKCVCVCAIVQLDPFVRTRK